MAKSYYSTVFDQSADAFWNVIRDFNNYPVWVDGAGTSHIEGGKTGDTVGAIRDVLYKDMRRRQRLLALSDAERSQTYEFAAGFRPNTHQLIKFGYTIQQGAEYPGTQGNVAAIEFVTSFRALSLTAR